MKDRNEDFGFTFVDKTEYDEYEKTLKDQLTVHSTVATKAQERLDKVMGLIDIFLNNLGSEPDKVYIKWPNRVERIKAFRNRLNAVVKE